jgi:hypothetical protein
MPTARRAVRDPGVTGIISQIGDPFLAKEFLGIKQLDWFGAA